MILYLFVYLAITLIFNTFFNRYLDQNSKTILSIGIFFLTLFSMFSFTISIIEGTRGDPKLIFESLSDTKTYYRLATTLAYSTDMLSKTLNIQLINHWGYPIFLGFIFKFFGVDLLYGLLANLIIMSISIFFMGVISFKITLSKKILNNTLLLSFLTGQLLSLGVVLLKDTLILLSIVFLTYSLVDIYNSKFSIKNSTLFIFSSILLTLTRAQYLFVPPLMIVIIFRKKFSKFILMIPVLFLVLFLGTTIGKRYSTTEYSVDYLMDQGIQTKKVEKDWDKNLSQNKSSFMGRFVSGFEQWSLVKRVLFIPIFTAIQYLTPFDFWRIDSFHPYFLIERNMNIVWFLFVGPIIFLSIYFLWRYKKEYSNNLELLFSISILGLILYIIPAYVRGGTVPRYAIIFLPLMLPSGAWLLFEIKNNIKIKFRYQKITVFYYVGALLAGIAYLFIKI